MLFALVLVQLMIMPDVLIVENYRTMTALGIKDTILAIGLPYMASAFGIFLLRQTFKTVPARARRGGARRRLLAAADAVEGLRAARAADLPRVRAGHRCRYHWNNFLWPLIITNSVESRPVTVGPAGVLVDRPGHRLVDHHARRRC